MKQQPILTIGGLVTLMDTGVKPSGTPYDFDGKKGLTKRDAKEVQLAYQGTTLSKSKGVTPATLQHWWNLDIKLAETLDLATLVIGGTYVAGVRLNQFDGQEPEYMITSLTLVPAPSTPAAQKEPKK